MLTYSPAYPLAITGSPGWERPRLAPSRLDQENTNRWPDEGGPGKAPTPRTRPPEAPTGQMRPVPGRASARGLRAPEVQAQPANDINALIKFIQVSVPVDMQLFREGAGIPSLTGENLELVWTQWAATARPDSLMTPHNAPQVSCSRSPTCFSVIA